MRWPGLILFFFFPLMVGCGLRTPVEKLSTQSLQVWLTQEIQPYLTQRFSRHPRFKNATFSFTHMAFGQIDPNTDALSAGVIRQLQSALAKQPINLVVWDDAQNVCGKLQAVRYLIGVEARVSNQGNLEVRIDAYDQAQENWTLGFEKIWRWKLTADDEAQLLEQTLDLRLLGEKFLPFEEKQSARLIDDFKQALDCYTMQENKPVRIQRSGEFLPPKLTDWMRVIEDFGVAAGQPVQLIANAVNRDARIFSLTLVADDVSLLKRFVQFDKEVVPVRPRLKPITINPLKSQPGPLVSEISIDLSSPILQKSTLIKPHGVGLCATGNPWELGAKDITAQSELSSDNCFAIELSVQRPALPVLIGRNASGQLSRFHPTTCRFLDDAEARIGRNETFYFPTRLAPVQALGLDDNIGEERIYVTVSANSQVQGDWLRSLEGIPTICDAQNSDPVGVDVWERKLKQFETDNKGLFQWRAHVFQHVVSEDGESE